MLALRGLCSRGVLTASECVQYPIHSACIVRGFSSANHPTVYFSGMQPTGIPHLGNYFGFIQPWLNVQNTAPSTSDLYLSIADYHALSTGFVPREQMRKNILHLAAGLLACGVDPERTILFQQSEVNQHTNLMYLLASLQTLAKLRRLPQYKDKAQKIHVDHTERKRRAKHGGKYPHKENKAESKVSLYRYKSGEVPVNLLTYPILQAADVLLYKGTHVPVGLDQSQHINLLTDLARRFNTATATNFFPIPKQVTGSFARIKSLRDVTKKMSKSDANSRARIEINDSPAAILDKCKKAVSDFDSDITFDPDRRPAVSNLIAIYAAVSGKSTDEVVREAEKMDTRQFKEALAAAVDEHFAPIRERFNLILRDEAQLRKVLNHNNHKAMAVASRNLDEIRHILGMKL